MKACDSMILWNNLLAGSKMKMGKEKGSCREHLVPGKTICIIIFIQPS